MKTTREQRNEIYKQISERLNLNHQFICNILNWDLLVNSDLKNYNELFFIVSESIEFERSAIDVNDDSINDSQYILIKQICLDLAQLIKL